ncbi:mfs multidrug transporter [Diplodia corticola]|uniref:Mfs multidrug transporter n=1 Tax=Diplodia corticola TaxID=236234 RepID=A0A1J9QZV8_9PEZI|nr:mfs multidrug transporter [Diplodia corticola]OJD33905.1 mfs multidrug transporter [Diplodia corticola]
MPSGDASRASSPLAEGRDVSGHGLLPAFGSTLEDGEPARRSSHDGQPGVDEGEGQAERAKDKPVTWSSLPRKDQLMILTLARLSEPLTQTSLQAYMFYQLKSFDPSLPDSTIASQAGILQGAFTATQFVTAVLWGRVADAEWAGRKKVILIGLLGTAISALGFGFSKSFVTAVVFRCLGGMLNGNIGVMRTMIAEIIKEKKYQSRAFLLLPMTFNIGVIIGPVLGGLLADPAANYPYLFGPGSLFGGRNGVGWMTEWPYALPNLVSAVFLFCSSMAILFGLEETHEALQGKPDFGIRLRRWLSRNVLRRLRRRSHPPGDYYQPVPTDDRPHTPDQQPTDIEMATTPLTPSSSDNSNNNIATQTPRRNRRRPTLPFHRIWTPQVLLTFLAHFLLALHLGTLNSLWFTFLSTPRFDPSSSPSPQRPPLHFTGGLGLPPSRIGAALAILGAIGIALQLSLYPRIATRVPTTTSFRLSLLLFPIAYTLIPFLALIPTSTPTPSSGPTTAPAPATSADPPLLWPAIAAALLVVVAGRTFALPAAAILVNNSCPHPSVLGTVHGVAQSVSSGARTLGPVVGGWVFGKGLELGVVGLAWWGLAGVAAGGAVVGGFVREGGDHNRRGGWGGEGGGDGDGEEKEGEEEGDGDGEGEEEGEGGGSEVAVGREVVRK